MRIRKKSGLMLASCIVVTLSSAPALTQTPLATETEVAARELVNTMKLPEQIKAMLPMVLENFRPAIVQNRLDVNRAFDAAMPRIIEVMGGRMNDFTTTVAAIYAANFSREEIRAILAFYNTPVGQKLVMKTPLVMQQTMAAGQKWGESAGAEASKLMIEELGKK